MEFLFRFVFVFFAVDESHNLTFYIADLAAKDRSWLPQLFIAAAAPLSITTS